MCDNDRLSHGSLLPLHLVCSSYGVEFTWQDALELTRTRITPTINRQGRMKRKPISHTQFGEKVKQGERGWARVTGRRIRHHPLSIMRFSKRERVRELQRGETHMSASRLRAWCSVYSLCLYRDVDKVPPFTCPCSGGIHRLSVRLALRACAACEV